VDIVKNPVAAPFHHFVYGWPHSRKLGGGTALMSRLCSGGGEGGRRDGTAVDGTRAPRGRRHRRRKYRRRPRRRGRVRASHYYR